MTIFFKTSEILDAAYEGYSMLPTRKKQALSKELKETIFGKQAQHLWHNNYGSEKNPLPKKLLIIEHISIIKEKYGVRLKIQKNSYKWVKNNSTF